MSECEVGGEPKPTVYGWCYNMKLHSQTLYWLGIKIKTYGSK